MNFIGSRNYINEDKVVDIVEALLTAQYYAGLPVVTFNEAYADVNFDGAIDIIDALLIAQYYVGLIPNTSAMCTFKQ